jgi:hypothetical protein
MKCKPGYSRKEGRCVKDVPEELSIAVRRFPGKTRKNDVCSIDTYDVSQYEGERVVDHNVKVLEDPIKKMVLVYSPVLMANILVPKSELKRR